MIIKWLTIGILSFRASCSANKDFPQTAPSACPPRMAKSSAPTMTSLPATVPFPATKLAPV